MILFYCNRHIGTDRIKFVTLVPDCFNRFKYRDDVLCLIPEFVDSQTRTFLACPTCATDVKKRVVPPLSVKNGFDVGNSAKLRQHGLPDPSFHEAELISFSRSIVHFVFFTCIVFELHDR